MASTTTQLMTVEEYGKLPQDDGAFYAELRNGEIVDVPRPKPGHYLLHIDTSDRIRALAPKGSLVGYEFAYCPQEFELRVADVAYVSSERYATFDRNDYFRGAPDLVIEILSPSNPAADIREKEKLCLANGCKEFWVMDAKRRQIKVSTPDGGTETYGPGQKIPLPLFGNKRLAVDEIFK